MTNNEAELREKLAAIEHERWADWQKWVHKQLVVHDDPDGKPHWCLPPEVIDAWEAQIATPYSNLSEKEKDSDREQVDRYWHLITEQTRKARIEGGKDVFECFRDLWKNPPSDLDYHPEDAHWHANELYDMLDDLEADWLNQPHHKAEE